MSRGRVLTIVLVMATVSTLSVSIGLKIIELRPARPNRLLELMERVSSKSKFVFKTTFVTFVVMISRMIRMSVRVSSRLVAHLRYWSSVNECPCRPTYTMSRNKLNIREYISITGNTNSFTSTSVVRTFAILRRFVVLVILNFTVVSPPRIKGIPLFELIRMHVNAHDLRIPLLNRVLTAPLEIQDGPLLLPLGMEPLQTFIIPSGTASHDFRHPLPTRAHLNTMAPLHRRSRSFLGMELGRRTLLLRREMGSLFPTTPGSSGLKHAAVYSDLGSIAGDG